VLLAAACSGASIGTPSNSGSGGAGGTTTAAGQGGATHATGGDISTGGSSGSGGATHANTFPTGDIGTWTDAPGECPSDTTRIDVTGAADLASATRGEGSHAADPAEVCYFLPDGTYEQEGTSPVMYIQKGGTDAVHRRVFVRASRLESVTYSSAI
jgi:hypothetical protein